MKSRTYVDIHGVIHEDNFNKALCCILSVAMVICSYFMFAYYLHINLTLQQNAELKVNCTHKMLQCVIRPVLIHIQPVHHH